jgi:hypothetical protein
MVGACPGKAAKRDKSRTEVSCDAAQVIMRDVGERRVGNLCRNLPVWEALLCKGPMEENSA